MVRACSALLLSVLFAAPGGAFACDEPSRGQSVYVPAYSHIYYGNREEPFRLTVTLSIRNIEMARPIVIRAIDYYETQGKLMKKELSEPRTLGPLESMRVVIPHRDETGGSGANFIVKWTSDQAVDPPIIETIMIGTQQQQGISFTSRGRAISPKE